MYFCKDCRLKYLYISPEQRCHVCGKICRIGFAHKDCIESSNLTGLIYLTIFDKKIKEAFHDIKFHSYFDILYEIGEIMSDFFQLYKFSENSEIVSIPISYSRFLKRGFNQSHILAKIISNRSSLKYQDRMIKNRDVKSQTLFKANDRNLNVRDVFKLKKNVNIKGKTIIIIDDIYSTGSTMNECARILKQKGAEEVYGFTFAKAGEQ